MNKWTIGAVLSGAVALGVAAMYANDKEQAPLFEDKVVARGKGFEIKGSQVEEQFITLKASLAARGQSIPEAQRQTIETELLERLVVTQILMAKATEADRAEAQKTADEVFQRARDQFPSEEFFNQQIKASGMSLAAFRARLLEQSIAETVIGRELKPKVSVTDEEIRKYYDENPAQFEEPEQARASHILISTLDSATRAPLAEEQRREKRVEIEKLRARAVEGEDFGALARQFSEDPGSKQQGGEYTFPRGQMVAPFEAAAFSLKPGEVSQVVETQFGYHIIKLHEKLAARVVPFTEVSGNLKEHLEQTELRELLPGFIEAIKKEFQVEIVAAAKPQ